MQIAYLETKEAVSVPGNYGKVMKALFGFDPERQSVTAAGDWFTFEVLGNRTVLAWYKGDRDVLATLIPFENVKQMHVRMPAPAGTKK